MRARLLGSGLAALLVLGVGAGAALGQGSAPPEAYVPSAERGHALVQRDCAGCHAVETTGASPFTPAPPFRTLADRYPLEDLEEALTEGIMSGHPAMPQFEFSAEDAADIVAWMKGLEGA